MAASGNWYLITSLHKFRKSLLSVAVIAGSAVVGEWSEAAINWDAGGGTRWWFDEVNWATGSPQVNNVLPPSAAGGTSATDTQINIGTGAWDLGEGVVYDPANDPNFAGASALPFPAGFGPQIINQLYMSRNTTNANLLTIKGDLQTGNIQIGRSSGTAGVATNATIVQEAGIVKVIGANMDLAQTDTSNNGYGNGAYDYRGGSLEVGVTGPSVTLRLSAGTVSNAPNGQPAGAGGVARLIMHNPATGGHVRAKNVQFAAFAGTTDAVLGDGDPNGTTRGVAIAEFHYENGGVRPVQVMRDLSLNNGVMDTTGGIRSARLDLRLGEPVTLNAGVPVNLGLFDVDYDQTDNLDGEPIIGMLGGAGTLAQTFSSADGLTNYPAGSTVSAVFGNITYNWTISYSGNITWTDADNSVVASADGVGGRDIVLVGLSSETVVVDDADFDNDADVDGNDFLIWQRGVNSGTNNATGDADGNGLVNSADLTIWTSQFSGGASSPVVASVPEPSAAALGLSLLVSAFLRQVHRARTSSAIISGARA